MVRHSSCTMSVLPSASVESHLPASWGPHYPATDASVSMVTPDYPGRAWTHDLQPQYWSKYQVWEWLQQTLDMHQIDATSIPFQNFDVDGRQLCSMTYQDFTRAAGSVGPILYQSLSECNGQYGADMFTMDNKTEIEDFQFTIHQFKEEQSFYPSPGFFDIKPSFVPSVMVSSTSSQSPDLKRLHSRPHQVKKHNPRGTHLWEFIRDILLNPERNPGLIKWEDRSEGVFRFLKSEAVAQLWGKKKNNNSMTYEKLSRAMRYYYKREILERVDGRRLVYKFGRNARGWRESEK
ncbi:ETS homologous factor isoform X2 [Denticeps clupeoides]|uniref:ETS homologous factor isoform X2 n=1 Tax=Denticeps clupeoides TaxID=299321 RepID=UPI0010A396D7|nr:ETS homologous factor isoform X2 [Denticeps clupeoides]